MNTVTAALPGKAVVAAVHSPDLGPLRPRIQEHHLPVRASPKLSIIIPVLNEEALIADCAAHVRNVAPNAELIVVDGGSEDATAKIASELTDIFVQTKPGRAAQMNAGAEVAQGKYLLFLHVDTKLPEDLTSIFTSWVQTKPYWGYFPLRLSGSVPVLRVIERMINFRTAITSGATGDQCQVFKSEVFRLQGGFPPVPLMEDLALSRRLRRLIPPKVFPATVETSSRRWEKNGLCRTVLLMWALRFVYALGVHPRHFSSFYHSRT